MFDHMCSKHVRHKMMDGIRRKYLILLNIASTQSLLSTGYKIISDINCPHTYTFYNFTTAKSVDDLVANSNPDETCYAKNLGGYKIIQLMVIYILNLNVFFRYNKNIMESILRKR